MAELTPMEKLQPCLLDRLTDDDPSARQESRSQRVVSIQRYRRAVLRDLEWLLNVNSPMAAERDLELFEDVAHSVLNYGTPDLCGVTASSVTREVLEREILQAIRDFEPRIMRNTIEVIASSESADHNLIAFEVKGDLWAQPVPEPLYLKTELDLETGQCQIKGTTGG